MQDYTFLKIYDREHVSRVFYTVQFKAPSVLVEPIDLSLDLAKGTSLPLQTIGIRQHQHSDPSLQVLFSNPSITVIGGLIIEQFTTRILWLNRPCFQQVRIQVGFWENTCLACRNACFGILFVSYPKKQLIVLITYDTT